MEARLGLAVADLVVAGGALRARPARAHERDDHALPGPPPRHALADRLDDAGELVAGHVRERADVGVVAHPAVPVAAAQPGGLHPDHGAVRRGLRVGDGLDRRHPPEGLVDDRAHGRSLCRAAAIIERGSIDTGGPMPQPFTHLNLADVEDAAPGNGFGDRWEARVAREPLEAEATGVTHFRLLPGKRSPFTHRHTAAEETYVIIGGHGRMKLDDEIVDVRRLDAIRVPPRHRAGVRGRRRGARVHRVRPAPPGRRRAGRRPVDRVAGLSKSPGGLRRIAEPNRRRDDGPVHVDVLPAGGGPARPDEADGEAGMAMLHELHRNLRAAGILLDVQRLRSVDSATSVRVRDGADGDHRRPVRGDEGVPGRLLPRRVRGSRRGDQGRRAA